MSIELNLPPQEVRVLGALVEKSLTTPEYYPLTLNALVAACNQKSNREPSMLIGEKDVVRALDGLREKALAWSVALAGSRVPKYRHAVPDVLPVTPLELAILAELMLRGPQTVAELRAHTARMVASSDVAEIESALTSMAARAEGALVHRMGRQTGQRGERFAHGLSGAPVEAPERLEPLPESARLAVAEESARLAALEGQVLALQDALAQMQAQLADFRHQFE